MTQVGVAVYIMLAFAINSNDFCEQIGCSEYYTADSNLAY